MCVCVYRILCIFQELYYCAVVTFIIIKEYGKCLSKIYYLSETYEDIIIISLLSRHV